MMIFLIEKNGDVGVYQSLGAAEASMESPDILDGEYVGAFDEEGNVYSIGVPPGTEKTKGLSVEIKPGVLKPTGEKAAADLERALRQRFDEGSQGRALSLEELVERAITAATLESATYDMRVKKYGRVFLAFFIAGGLLYLLLRK